ncbi:helix-turn-helix domain-containing protein [Streptomyces sp. NPDC002232]|uniref:helix-turn-helix domain-containing protein n=1 Tax=Streptomyces sp. NPDC002232 TaxID=3364640 RepID=UPI00369BED10
MCVHGARGAQLLALDPNPAQTEAFARRTGAARWAFNYTLSVKVSAHRLWRMEVARLVAQGVEQAEARRRVKVPVPSKPQIQNCGLGQRGLRGAVDAPAGSYRAGRFRQQHDLWIA